MGALAGEALGVLLVFVVFGGKPCILMLFVWYKHSKCLIFGCLLGRTGAGDHCFLQGNCSDAMYCHVLVTLCFVEGGSADNCTLIRGGVYVGSWYHGDSDERAQTMCSVQAKLSWCADRGNAARLLHGHGATPVGGPAHDGLECL